MMVHASVPQQLPQHMSDVNMPYILHACRRPSASILRHCHHRLPLAMAVMINVAI